MNEFQRSVTLCLYILETLYIIIMLGICYFGNCQCPFQSTQLRGVSVAHYSIRRSHFWSACEMLENPGLPSSMASRVGQTAKVTSIRASDHAPNVFTAHTQALTHMDTDAWAIAIPLSAAEHVMPMPKRVCCCLLVMSALEPGTTWRMSARHGNWLTTGWQSKSIIVEQKFRIILPWQIAVCYPSNRAFGSLKSCPGHKRIGISCSTRKTQ